MVRGLADARSVTALTVGAGGHGGQTGEWEGSWGEEDPGDRILSVGGMWWRERALAKALAGLFGACGMLAALMRKARGADATQAG